VANPIQATRAGESDVVLTRILPDGSGFDFSTWLGGAGEEVAVDIALDSAGHLFVAGATASTDFPTLNPFQPAYGEQLDGFLARLDFEVPVLQPPPATQHFTATLIGVSAEPPNASFAKGVGRFVLDGNRLTYTADYSGLTSPPLGAHLHRADLAEVPGAVVRGHAGSSVPPGAGQLLGEVYLDATALSELANGLFHFDLHTTAFPRGEIRGRVVPGTNEPPSITFVANQAIQLNTSLHVAFTVNDSETAAGDILVRMRSSNNRLLPNDRLVLGGAGGNRTLTATPLPGEIGVTTITLEVRDAAGASATTCFKLHVGRPSENYDAGIGSLTVHSPASNAVVSGTISWSASARRTSRPEERDAMLAKGCDEEAITNGTCGVQDLTFFVDGEWLSQVGGSDATYQLDTAKLANGPHELTVRAQAWPDTSVWIGVDQRFVTVDNGRIALELRSGWNEIVLAPAQTEQMAPRRVFTDGEEETVLSGVTFSSSDTNVATVSGAGIVTGIAPGVTTITTSALGLNATTRVIVDVPVGFPHFGKDGAILYQYEPGRSLFVRTLFATDPREIEATSGLAEALKQGGLNALNTGFYINPVWTRAPDLETQVEGWEDQYWDRIEAVLGAHDFSFLFTGDDVARTTFELDNTLTNPWSKDFLQLALSRARDTRRVIAIEMVDEISFVWGDTPTPSDGRWLAGNPPIPDDAFIRLMMLMNGVSNRPAITWPIGGVSPPQVAANWMGNPAFADYATHYWDTWNHPYYFGGSPLPHIKQQMGDWAMYGRLAVIQRNRPQMALVGTTGPFYQKLGEGDHFIVGQDRLHDGEGGHRPKAVQSEIMFAAVAGMAGVRGYSYDWRVWKEERATGAIGRSDLQTGTDPFTVGTERWDAMSQAFNFIAEIEPYLLQPRVSAVDLGEFIATGARAGANGKMLMALNLSEVPQRIKANLQPYSATSGITRCRLTLNGAIKETLAARAMDDLWIETGETIMWIFNRPVVTWQPADLVAGTPLGAAQLDATANVPGTFAFLPTAGTVLSAGVHALSATFTPSDTNNYLPVTASATIQALKLGQTLDLPALTDRTTADSPFDLAATASSGLPVSFQVLAGPASVAGNTVTLTAPGIVTLRAVQDGNATYDAAFVDRSFVVTRGNTRPTIAALPEVTVNESSLLQVQVVASDTDTVLQVVPGGLLREVWTNLSDSGMLSSLRDPVVNPRWPDQPDLVETVPTFEAPVNAMDRYGVRLSGLLTVPETGDYTFFMSSDDEGALYLSTDDQPANKSLIASEPQWNGSREWLTGANQASRGNPPSNISAPIHLETARTYFVEALMKEGVSGDHLAVTWQLPSQPTAPENGSDPIGGAFLSALTRIPEPLRFSLVEAPPGVSIDPVTGWLTWTPSEPDGGQTHRVTIRVTDTGSPPLSAEVALDVTVIEENLAPAITPIPDVTATEKTLFTLTPTAMDEDLPPNALTWSLVPLVPAGMFIDPITGVLSWIPSETQAPGAYPITIRVTDDGTPPLWAERTFTLTVSVQPEIRLGDISRPSEGTFSFNWSSQPGLTYRVQFKNNLGEGVWTQLEPAITAIDVTATFSTPVSPDSQRFYRVVRD
jgi:hypothetical protein